MNVTLQTLNNKINRFHERAPIIVYSDYKSSFNTRFENDDTFSIHRRNIQSLAIEIYKFLHGLRYDKKPYLFWLRKFGQ